MNGRYPMLPVFVAAFVTLPGISVVVAHAELSPPMAAILAGTAILGAGFILLWACDAAQTDVSQALALAAVALIAVLPEYVVDMYFTWQAGKDPSSDYSHFAIANMTGANRLIIGVAWAAVVAIFWWKTRRPVTMEKDRSLEIRFLALASVYAFLIPIKGSLEWYDGIVLLGIYGWYLWIAACRGCTECELDGPAACIAAYPTVKRRATTIAMFLFAGVAIVANAEHFCEGLVGTGEMFGINQFLLVQWLAPLASEAPEFVVAIMFALRGRAGLALGSLLSAKLNQWTLLVGMIPGVFAISSGQLAFPLPLDHVQLHEILLTAAQSLLAIIMLATLKLTPGQAILLFVLFIGQLVSPVAVKALPNESLFGLHADKMHPLFSLLYLVSAATLILDRPTRLAGLLPWLRKKRPEDTEAAQPTARE